MTSLDDINTMYGAGAVIIIFTISVICSLSILILGGYIASYFTLQGWVWGSFVLTFYIFVVSIINKLNK